MSSHSRIRCLRATLDCALTFALLSAPLRAQGAPTPADPVPPHDTFTVDSRSLGEIRRINVYTPPAYDSSSKSRFPVLYMPDGGLDEDFPHVVHTVDSLIALRVIRPVIVVGIPNTERRRDLTGPTRIKSDSAIAPRVGHYVAFDPSLWWNGGALLDSASARLAAADRKPRTFYLASSKDDIDSRTAQLAGFLRAAQPRGLAWVHEPRLDQTHATIFRAAGPGALALALR